MKRDKNNWVIMGCMIVLFSLISTQVMCAQDDGAGRKASHGIESLCPDNNHPHMIDLGLPSGIKWACCNIGAKSPTEYGNYYAWGETQPKNVYDWSTYKWGKYRKFTKYCTNSDNGLNGFVDNKSELDLADDAAYINWGSGWRMPSDEQMKELQDYCTIEWTTVSGVGGLLFKSNRNNASMFFPAAGFRDESSLYNDGSCGYYYSCTLGAIDPSGNYRLYFYSDYGHWNSWDFRYFGCSVRAVHVPQD